MSQQFTLKPQKASTIDPDRIVIRNELNVVIATIYADGNIAFTKNVFTREQIDEILAISKNFYLFYENLINKTKD